MSKRTQKMKKLEPWDRNLAEAIINDGFSERYTYLACETGRDREEAVGLLAEAMESDLKDAFFGLFDFVPEHVICAMDGFCQLNPDLDFRAIADVLIEDIWPEGTEYSKNLKSGAVTSKVRAVPRGTVISKSRGRKRR